MSGSAAELPPAAEAEELFAKTLCRWRLAPITFLVEELRFRPDHWQADAVARFTNIEVWRLALVACKGPGKSALLAALIWLFLVVNLDLEPKVAITSITEDNLKDGLWAELRKWYKRSGFLQRTFKFGTDRITRKGGDPESCFISARKWSRKADPEEQEQTLAGLHGDAVALVIDEAGGIPKAVLAAADGVLTTAGTINEDTGIPRIAKVVIAGNPNLADGPLWDACEDERELWEVVRVTGDPDDPLRAPRVSERWAREQIQKYGIDSPWVQTNVFGQFPKSLTEGVVTVHDFRRAYGRKKADNGVTLKRGKKTIGADIARRGKNRTVFAFRDGDFIDRIEVHEGKGVDETAILLREAHIAWKSEATYYDDNGIGGAVGDILTGDSVPDEDQVEGLVPVNACETSSSPYHVNLRSQMAEHVQQRFRRGEIGLDPTIKQTTAQKEACGIWFVFGNRGKRKLVDKDEYSRKKGGSPDVYDAIALSISDGAGTEGQGGAGEEDELKRGMAARATASREPRTTIDNESGEWLRRRTSVRIRRAS